MKLSVAILLVFHIAAVKSFSTSSVLASLRHRHIITHPSSLPSVIQPKNRLQDSSLHSSASTSNEESFSDDGPETTSRFRDSLPKLDAMDQMIIRTSVPSMINLAVVPLVNAVDTFYVGRLGVALALAGQSAAGNAFFTLYFLVAFLPTLTAPLVAEAIGSGDEAAAQERVCESLFLCNFLGGLGTILLVGFPRLGLSAVLQDGAPAMKYAHPYLRWRALSMVPTLVSATGFAAYRGLLDTVTPLKVSLFTNALNLVLDPLFIFTGKMGFLGAAFATALSETASGLIYIRLLLRKKLITLRKMVRPPSWKALKPILQGGGSVLARQAAINLAIVGAARRAQVIDPTGVAAAAYGIVMNMYSIGIVIHIAIQSTAAALIPATRAKQGTDAARQVADRIFVWGTIVGFALGAAQFLALPFLVPLFSTLPEVQEAVRAPAIISSFIHVVNGIVFAGEGAMMGLGSFRDLALLTAGGTAILLGLLSTALGTRLDGILLSLAVFNTVEGVCVLAHYLKIGPLANKRKIKTA